MSAQTVSETIAARQGWTDTTLLDLCLTYITNQSSDDTFADYLNTVAADENSSGGCFSCGGPTETDGDGVYYCAADCTDVSNEDGGTVCEGCSEPTDRKDRHGTLMCEDCDPDDGMKDYADADPDEEYGPYDQVCAHCGNALNADNYDHTGARRCATPNTTSPFHAPIKENPDV